MQIVWEGIGTSPIGSGITVKSPAGIPNVGELIGLGNLAMWEQVKVSRIEWHVAHTLLFFKARLEPIVFVKRGPE